MLFKWQHPRDSFVFGQHAYNICPEFLDQDTLISDNIENNIVHCAFSNDSYPSIGNSFPFYLIPLTFEVSVPSLYLLCMYPHSSDIHVQMNSWSIFHPVFCVCSHSPSWLSSIWPIRLMLVSFNPSYTLILFSHFTCYSVSRLIDLFLQITYPFLSHSSFWIMLPIHLHCLSYPIMPNWLGRLQTFNTFLIQTAALVLLRH